MAAVRRWGAESAENRAELVTWKDEALRAIAENKGGHIASGSGNGVSFTQQVSMTNAEWFTVLDQAIVYIDAGISPPSKTYVRVI